jgi:hypothetical protein
MAMTPLTVAIAIIVILAVWLTVKSDRARNLEACQIFSLAAGIAWGVVFVIVLDLWLSA